MQGGCKAGEGANKADIGGGNCLGSFTVWFVASPSAILDEIICIFGMNWFPNAKPVMPWGYTSMNTTCTDIAAGGWVDPKVFSNW